MQKREAPLKALNSVGRNMMGVARTNTAKRRPVHPGEVCGNTESTSFEAKESGRKDE